MRNIINRRNVTSRPKNSFDACDDFFVDAHIIAAAFKSLKMTALLDTPLSSALPDDVWIKSNDERRGALHIMCRDIVNVYVRLDTNNITMSKDSVYSYACQLLSLGLLYREFCDSIRERDGYRILRCWRYLFLLFKVSGRTNYAIEAFIQYHFLFSPRQCNQLIWSRCVNIHRLPGSNIPADLFMEHLNRLCKEAIKNLGSNKTEKAIQQVGKVISVNNSVNNSMTNYTMYLLHQVHTH